MGNADGECGWGMRNGECGMRNAECGMRMGNADGEWGMGNGECGMRNADFLTLPDFVAVRKMS
jgi:hypothetical protein